METAVTAPDVFICHSSVDARQAAEICARLEDDGLTCWIAPRNAHAGVPYARQLVNAIAATRVVLFVLSSNSNDSVAVLNELELATNRGKVILPVRIEDVTPSVNLEYYVRAIHWFDATVREADLWPQLSQHVRSLVGESPEEQDFAASSPRGNAQAPRVKGSSLPMQVTSFVGRQGEIAEIEALLSRSRLVTLVASGGAGKTRAALEVGSRASDAFPQGVWLVELAPITDPSLVTPTIAGTLGLRESFDTPLLDTLLAHLADRRLLLVIDNCEHVIDEVRRVVAAMIRGTAELRVLATSRERLNIAAEHAFRLPSLALPDAGETPKPAAAAEYGAVELFVERAGAADDRFTLDDANVRHVVEICRRLDGIPLAIELAAARVKVLSPAQIAARLDERFRVLTGGDRSALPRHQTMRALIDWSYDLLAEEERSVFRKLSVFADGFTLEGACCVCAGEEGDEIAVLDALTSLVDKSLLQVDPSIQTRYRMLESTRQYARAKLQEHDELEACADSHLQYVGRLFKQSGEEYETTMREIAVKRLAPQLEDARSALSWAAERGRFGEATDLLLATPLWDFMGLQREAMAWTGRLLELSGEEDPARLAGLWGRSSGLAVVVGNYASAREAAHKMMGYARAAGDPGVLVDGLLRYAAAMFTPPFDEALAAIDEAERLGTSSARRKVQALHSRGMIEYIRGNLDAAARCLSEALRLYETFGNDAGTVSAALSLAEVEHARGATGEAIRIATDALAGAERLADRGVWAHLMKNLAGYLSHTGDVRGARRAAYDAISFYASFDPDGAYAASALEHFALCAALEGDVRMAATLAGYAQKTLAEHGFEREYTELNVARASAALAAGELGRAGTRGAALARRAPPIGRRVG